MRAGVLRTVVSCVLAVGTPGCAQTQSKAGPLKLAASGGRIRRVAWSPGGSRVAFISEGRNRSTLVVCGFPKASTVDLGAATAFAWSPDGARIAIARPRGKVALRDMKTGAEKTLCDGTTPVFSRNGRSLAVVRQGRIFRVALNGAERQLTAKAMMSVELSDGPDGWFFTGDGMLWRVNEDGPQKRVLTNSGMGTGGGNLEYFVDLSVSPDGKRVAIVSTGAQDAGGAPSRVFLVGADGTGKIEIGPGRDLCWTPDSRAVVYAFKGDLWSYAIGSNSPRRLTSNPATGHDSPAVSPKGKQIAYSAAIEDTSGDGRIDWRDKPALFARVFASIH